MDSVDQENLEYLAICRLQAAYADAVSRRAWADLDPLFLADAPITVDTVTGAPFEHVGAAGIGGFIAGAIERFEFFELVILNVHMLAGTTADAARSRSFTCELRQESVERPLVQRVRRVPRRARQGRRPLALRPAPLPVDRAYGPQRDISLPATARIRLIPSRPTTSVADNG